MSDDRPREDLAADLRFVLQETRTLLLQQLLAVETGPLSVPELLHRNPDLDANNVRYHLREMADRGVVERRKIPPGDRVGDLPNTFFAATDRGVQLLERAGLREEVEMWAEMYARMQQTAEIERITRSKEAARLDDNETAADDAGSTAAS